ncbi:MAG: hypothetical protein KVP17_003301 [Porospora cf. gigantea B]|nr:MAG: hypothetical protein KVP17_003301 [Porospora cf. gigantea B]
MFFFVTPREVDIAKDRILDASTMLPDHHGSCPRTSFLEARLPGALFWDVDSIADTSSEEGRLLPHMAPSLQTLRLALCRLGVKSTDRVVIYDQSNGLYCASFRLMWTLMLYSFPGEIRVLRGGLQAWKEASLEL